MSRVKLGINGFRPRWDAGQLVRYCGYISGIVAVSAVLIGLVLLDKRTTFPSKAYGVFPEQLWGSAFLIVGLFHSWRLIRWWAGKAEPLLVPAHIAQIVISVFFFYCAILSTFADNTGWLVCVFITGGMMLALLTSQLDLWSDPAGIVAEEMVTETHPLT